jgi:hypothetical protein
MMIFSKIVMFTNEVRFINNGSVNLEDNYRSVQNSYYFGQIDHQRQWSVNVYIDISENFIIMSYFFIHET